MTAFTPKTITSAPELQADLARVRERGYAIDDEELTPDVRCVAAPIFDFFGAVIGCVGISGPASRMSDERLGVMGSRVRDTADAITQKLGGRPPQRVDAPPAHIQ